MPSPVLLASDSVAGTSQFLKDVRPGKYSHFVLILSSAAAAAAESLTPAEFGRVELLQGGAPIVTCDFDNLRNINRLKGGMSHLEGTAAGIHQMMVVIPRGYYDNNVHQVNQQDQLQAKIAYGATFTTVFTGAQTATQKLYGLVRETGKMAYNLRIHQIDKTYGSGVFREPLNMENVFAIYVVPPATFGDLRRVRVEKDGIEMCNATFAGSATADSETDLNDISAVLNQTDSEAETAFAALPAEITVAEPGEIGEFLSDDVAIEFTTIAAAPPYTQEMVVFSGDFTDTKLDQTSAEEAAVIQRKISRKQQHGKRRPVTVLRQLGQG